MKDRLNILLGGLGLFALLGCKAPQGGQARQPIVHTPRLIDFARESMVLTSAMSNCPLSSPHRGSLLTGMYPNKSGVP